MTTGSGGATTPVSGPMDEDSGSEPAHPGQPFDGGRLTSADKTSNDGWMDAVVMRVRMSD